MNAGIAFISRKSRKTDVAWRYAIAVVLVVCCIGLAYVEIVVAPWFINEVVSMFPETTLLKEPSMFWEWAILLAVQATLLCTAALQCLCSISCCGFSHDDFSGLGRACRPRNGLNWMVLVSPPERTGKDYDQHAPSTVYPSFAAERGIRRVDRAENTCQRADGA